MSRIGRKPIPIKEGVKVSVEKSDISVVGPKGNLHLTLPGELTVEQFENEIKVVPTVKRKVADIHGLFRSLISNAVIGVSDGWSKTLELVGVGFRAQLKGNDLTMNLGFSHPVDIKVPEGITFEVKGNKITVKGIDKYLVGETAATIRRVKPPEPYKGKGIRYENEVVRRKLGKAAKAVGTGG